MRAMWELCKGKMVCEGVDAMDADGAEGGIMSGVLDDLDANGQPRSAAAAAKKAHGGCGTRQPSIKREGLKLMAVYKQAGEVTNARLNMTDS